MRVRISFDTLILIIFLLAALLTAVSQISFFINVILIMITILFIVASQNKN